MALTRTDVETILLKRLAPLMVLAGMDGETVPGNADLNDPEGRAIRDLGYTVAAITLVTNTDIAQVPESEYDQFLDLAEYHTLNNILGNYDDVDLKVGPRDEKFSQTVTQIENRIKRLEGKLERNYGYGLAVPTAVVVTADFASHGDDTDY